MLNPKATLLWSWEKDLRQEDLLLTPKSTLLGQERGRAARSGSSGQPGLPEAWE